MPDPTVESANAVDERGGPPPDDWLTPRNAVLDALEAGKPVTLQGRNLRGVSLPSVPLRRKDAFEWFEIGADDSVRRIDQQD